ncbi:chemotaxis protein CheA [Pseudaquabacterium pictum]|uniref:Chemotaxis protein CheA n=1 Tax=Pseudaquabacterium pictum TaxID=2315236 RepID=A0A480B206_9BURK|nr:chemotaxis protein CheA [Rubrivivax pictus]GCL65915.1 chemotaxis protein CheA [Rubrivivax pictus]
MMDIDLSEAFAAFLVEGRELLQALEQGFLQLEQGHDRNDPELINALFRAAHTIKGSAGIVGIPSLGRFTHHLETLLDRVRDGEPLLDDNRLTLLLRCCDHIGRLLDLAEAGDTQGLGLGAQEAALLQGLAVPQTAGHAVAAPAPAPAATPEAGHGFRLWAVFGADSLRDGIDPGIALHYLGEQVQIAESCLLTDLVPALAALDAEGCCTALALRATDGSPAQALSALEFFGDGTLLAVCGSDSAPAAVHAALQPLRDRLGDDALQPWRDAGLVSAAEWAGQATPAAAAAAEQPADAPADARPAEAAGGHRAAAPQRFVRVPADRLDQLILQVGELVIAGATADVLARRHTDPKLQESLSHLAELIDTIQSGTLQLRMVPIGETFSRFQRVVRDVALDLGKSIALDIVGGDTELDKALVERIGDPLMHLVRNAMDHGLETPAERLAQGKPAQGTLRLRAFHDSGNVVIEVSDDGRGLDRARIAAKAVARGLIASADGMSDSEVHQLIFEPGFSTAEQVTSLSGRGVGMDVVKQAIEALRGAISLQARPGQGTLVQLRLPLTLAIIDGFMVGVDQARFILPLDLVVECIELPADALQPDAPNYLNLRGEVLPYVCLRQAFQMDGQRGKRPSVVVVRSGETKTGVLVDSLHGEIQTVIKPMNRIFRHLRAVSGTSILGSGDIALILDLHQLVQGAVDRAARGTALPIAA